MQSSSDKSPVHETMPGTLPQESQNSNTKKQQEKHKENVKNDTENTFNQSAPKDNKTDTHFEGTNTINPNCEKRGHLPEPHDKEQFPQENAELAPNGAKSAGLVGQEVKDRFDDYKIKPNSLDNKTDTHFEGTNTINPNCEKRGHLPEPHDKEQFPNENAKLAPGGAGKAGLIGKE